MTGMTETVDDQIVECLNGRPQIQAAGPDSWEFTVPGVQRVSVQRDRDWLCLRAPLGESGSSEIPEGNLSHFLRAQGSLLTAAKLGYDSKTAQPWLLAEIPIDEEAELDGVVDQNLAAFQQLARIWNGDGGEHQPAAQARDPSFARRANLRSAVQDSVGDHMAEQCREAGWTYTARRDGRLMIPLDVRNGFCQVTIEPVDPSGVRVAFDLGWLPTEAACRLATAWFLLAASYRIRWARPVLVDAGGQDRCCWEVLLQSPTDSKRLDRALTALSVACQLCRREFEALRDEAVARWFVRFQIPKKGEHSDDCC
jgi:hypothetical protein